MLVIGNLGDGETDGLLEGEVLNGHVVFMHLYLADDLLHFQMVVGALKARNNGFCPVVCELMLILMSAS